MNNPRSKKYKSIVAEVNEILYSDWAPIGFVSELPKDEYEIYAARVVSMLVSHASESDVAEYLLQVEAKIIELNESESSERARKVASKLILLGENARAAAL